jgi:hypothetical protein
MKRFVWTLVLLAANCLTIQNLYSDEVTDAFDKARQAYDAKDYSQSTSELNKALNGIQKIISGLVIQCLPGPMEGWERAEPTSSLNEPTFGILGGSGNTYSVEVNYSKKEPAQQIVISISNIPHIVQIAKAGIQLLSNPFFAKMQEENKSQSQEKIETYKLGDFDGAKTTNVAQKTAETSLFYGDLLVQVRGSGIEDPQIVEKFVQAVNYEELKKFSVNQEKPQEKQPEKQPEPSEQKA